MTRRRMILTATACLLLAGMGAALLGRTLYLRSDRYRRALEERLVTFFGLPVQVGAVQPIGWNSRELKDVVVWLPGRRDKVFECPRAVWETNGDSIVRLEKPRISIGSESWEREDYGRVLRASLQHDFERFDLRQIIMQQATLIWPRRDFELRVDGVHGAINFDETGSGRAEFVSDTINNVPTGEPVRITGRIDPHSQKMLPEVTLVVPRLPLATLGLSAVLHSQISQGTFAGRIKLFESASGDRAEVKGNIQDVKLEELTSRLAGGPISALLDLSIDDGLIVDGQPTQVTFHGEVRKLGVDSFLPRLGLPPMGGQLRLAVQRGEITPGGIARLQASGEWTGGSLDALTKAVLGREGVHGQLRVKMDSLLIENNRLSSGQLEVTAEPPPGSPGTIDRALLLDQVQRLSGLPLPQDFLPASVEFVHIGAILIIDHDRVRVLSGHGPAGRALITARIWGQDFPLLAEVDQTFSLDPLLARAGQRVQELKGTLQKRLAPVSSRPATSSAAD